jgi:cellulose synthase/poly-beta-1,6-N-acetylglucosamine synthase-like glycosyltransferase
MLTRALFWTATTLVAYSYVAFPAIEFLRARVRSRPVHAADISPSVSIVIAAHNEAEHIGRKLDSLSQLDYPAELVQVVVASDGSDDGTPAIVSSSPDGKVTLLDLPRVGKAAALCAGVSAATGEIIVLSDANSELAPDALRQLVRPFADPEVGGVAGNQRYLPSAEGEGNAAGERSFWAFDRALKRAQSKAGNTIAATGALYAVRRELFPSVPAGVTDDLYVSLSVIDAGYRLVFEPKAIAWEPAAPSAQLEYGRKVRIMTRGLRCVATWKKLLDPRHAGFYALELLSRKVLMRMMALPLLVVAVTSALLARDGWVYRLALAGQLAVYTFGAAGLVLSNRPTGRMRLFALPAYFCLVQLASLHATWNLLTGRTYDRWQPRRR